MVPRGRIRQVRGTKRWIWCETVLPRRWWRRWWMLSCVLSYRCPPPPIRSPLPNAAATRYGNLEPFAPVSSPPVQHILFYILFSSTVQHILFCIHFSSTLLLYILFSTFFSPVFFSTSIFFSSLLQSQGQVSKCSGHSGVRQWLQFHHPQAISSPKSVEKVIYKYLSVLS